MYIFLESKVTVLLILCTIPGLVLVTLSFCCPELPHNGTFFTTHTIKFFPLNKFVIFIFRGRGFGDAARGGGDRGRGAPRGTFRGRGGPDRGKPDFRGKPDGRGRGFRGARGGDRGAGRGAPRGHHAAPPPQGGPPMKRQRVQPPAHDMNGYAAGNGYAHAPNSYAPPAVEAAP